MKPPKLIVLDVGHGNCSILFNTRGIIVIDAGPGGSLLEFIIEHNIRRIDAILISHADKDHIEGVVALLASNIVEIGLVKLNSDAMKGTELWDDLAYELDKGNFAGKLKFEVGLTTNDTNNLDYGEIGIEILAPRPYLAAKGPGATDRNGKLINTNTVSAVVRLTRENIPMVLISGDIDELGLSYLVDSGVNVNAPIWIFPHHGGKSGQKNLGLFTEQFTELVKPNVVIFSIGRVGRLANPQPEVVIGLRKKQPTARILCTQLSKHCAGSLPVGVSLHIPNIFSRGRVNRSCCAGSIVIELIIDNIRVLPEIYLHRTFIVDNAPTALCKNW
jgi:competence protein ComEC